MRIRRLSNCLLTCASQAIGSTSALWWAVVPVARAALSIVGDYWLGAGESNLDLLRRMLPGAAHIGAAINATSPCCGASHTESVARGLLEKNVRAALRCAACHARERRASKNWRS